jgi:toxin YoeB
MLKSMTKVLFHQSAFEQYQHWQSEDPAIFNRINELIRQCMRTPFKGIGKPEPLRKNLRGFWSRRISGEHRLVYKYENDTLIIIQCRYHY